MSKKETDACMALLKQMGFKLSKFFPGLYILKDDDQNELSNDLIKIFLKEDNTVADIAILIFNAGQRYKEDQIKKALNIK